MQPWQPIQRENKTIINFQFNLQKKVSFLEMQTFYVGYINTIYAIKINRSTCRYDNLS